MPGPAAGGSVLLVELGLRGSRVLITGASRGIGFAVADVLAAEGAAVGLVARGADGLAAAASRLARHSVPVATVAADVTDTPALGRAVTDIAASLGGLDHLVANAGGTVGANLADSAPGDFTATFALNAGHAAELIRAGPWKTTVCFAGDAPWPLRNSTATDSGRDYHPPPPWAPSRPR